MDIRRHEIFQTDEKSSACTMWNQLGKLKKRMKCQIK